MDNQFNHTGERPPEVCSTGSPQWKSTIATPTARSKRDLIEMWYIEPLKKMSGHQAFVCLANCFFLYEKYLKRSGKISQGHDFTKGHKVFDVMGKDFGGVDNDTAFEIWSCWRNGLAHYGMPKISEIYKWGLDGKEKHIVTISGDNLTINPWLLRDMILDKVSANKSIWNDEIAPLMQEFIIIEA